jgi:hypothetical protein
LRAVESRTPPLTDKRCGLTKVTLVASLECIVQNETSLRHRNLKLYLITAGAVYFGMAKKDLNSDLSHKAHPI